MNHEQEVLNILKNVSHTVMNNICSSIVTLSAIEDIRKSSDYFSDSDEIGRNILFSIANLKKVQLYLSLVFLINVGINKNRYSTRIFKEYISEVKTLVQQVNPCTFENVTYEFSDNISSTIDLNDDVLNIICAIVWMAMINRDSTLKFCFSESNKKLMISVFVSNDEIGTFRLWKIDDMVTMDEILKYISKNKLEIAFFTKSYVEE